MQLYLALRVAGYHEFIKTREPLSFVADHILETFDDDRSTETFKLFCDLSKHGQVIYLTHYAHLCAMAREVCGNKVAIHPCGETILRPHRQNQRQGFQRSRIQRNSAKR